MINYSKITGLKIAYLYPLKSVFFYWFFGIFLMELNTLVKII